MHSSPSECQKAAVLRQRAVVFPLNIYGQTYNPVHAEVSLCAGATQGSILVHSKRQEERLRFDLRGQGVLQFSLMEKSSLTFDGFTWVPLARAFLGYLLPMCSWKEASFYTWKHFVYPPLSRMAETQLGLLPFTNLRAGVVPPSSNLMHIWKDREEVTQSQRHKQNVFCSLFFLCVADS